MSPQQTIAHYRIGAKLGEGGMGAVYRATDTKLNRDVAIKVLPDSFAADPDRLARFGREAQLLAALNHPNIAAIYGVEERALVLELVEGPTLADRIALGPIPIDEALPIARQIAEGLEYAHEKGIVHRDLKPANIKITPEGRVKVLDFGLAKALASDPVTSDVASSPTLTMRATMAGVIMGTAGYMSPEQAKGRPADRRADIWAFGVVLVEMLSGRMIYTAETVSETLAAVLLKDPDLGGLPPNLPPAVHRLIRRCLEKDPAKRLQAIGEARIAIDNVNAVDEAPLSTPAAAPVRRGAPWWALAAAVLTALALGGLLWRETRPTSQPLLRFTADLGPDATAGTHLTVVVSPDGRRIVYPVRSGGGNILATRLMEQAKATVLSGTEGGQDPFFSPDGQWVGFSANEKLKKVSVQGGAALSLCDSPGFRGAWWGEDGNIIAALGNRDGLSRIPAAGGTPQKITRFQNGEITHRWPQLLPGGHAVLFTAHNNGSQFDDANIEVISLDTGQVKIVQRGGFFARYLPNGYLTFLHQGTMFAAAFDLGRLEMRGAPAPVVEGIAVNAGTSASQVGLSGPTSGSGVMAYLEGQMTASLPIVWLDAAGKEEPLVAATAALALDPRFSPDGKRLAVSSAGDIYIYDVGRGALQKITNSAGASYPVWSPDGSHIVYGNSGGLGWIRADGSGQPLQIYGTTAVPGSISPDGRNIGFHQAGSGTSRDLWILPLDTTDPDHPKPGTPELFLATKGADIEPAFSPDGRWLAYSSNESGTYQVFVRPFPGGAEGGGQTQLSLNGGRFPVWSRTAKEIYYADPGGHIMAVPYTISGRTFNPGKPRQWSDTHISLMGNNTPLDLAPDGKRFAIYPAQTADSNGKTNLHAVFLLNFFDEVARRIPR